jgi:hypothetical protein
MLDPDRPVLDRLEDHWGCSVLDRSGARIGSLEEVFHDGSRDGDPAWLGVGIGLLGRRMVLVPANDLIAIGLAIQVPFDLDLVCRSPELGHDDLDAHTLRTLRAYYAIVEDVVSGRGSATT